MKKVFSIILSATLIFSVAGCSSWSKTANGGLIGGGAGAAIGAGIGVLLGGDAESAAIGAALGAGVGGGAGAIIGNRMDKKAEELAALEAAKVEKIEDVNGLEGLRVTFDSGILFGFNSSNLSDESKETLSKFVETMKDMEQTDITIYGHTDNVGTEQANERVSARRADAVADYLKKCGMSKDRIITKGMSFNMPVASNDTEEGRAQNRRVEIYITANQEMMKEAAGI
jgi:outer membrane protein OmpA-like peptidoglycan-associated protein